MKLTLAAASVKKRRRTKMYNKNDPETIRSLFNSIAKQYDRTNAVLSFQMHKRWNQALIQEALVPANPSVFLDLCCGTGAIAFEYLKSARHPKKAYMLDFSEGMLEHARYRAKELAIVHHEITYLQADAQHIPMMTESVECATIAYGIRNVKHPSKCIQEVYRVLAAGGSFGILELTQPTNPLLRFGHRFYLRTMLPLIGKLLTSNRDAYRYLCNSINTFIPADELERLMRSAGFRDIHRHAFLGGIATLLVGKK